MPRAFKAQPLIVTDAKTFLLGAGNASSDNFTDKEKGKLVKLVADSRYNLCAAGDEIEGYVNSVENALQNGYSVGGIVDNKRMYAIADGLQATPGTGTLTLGGYVVTGTVVAKGTALTTYPKVCLATTPSGLVFRWRVIAFSDGTGAVGQTVCIERV